MKNIILGLDIEPNYSNNVRTFSVAIIKNDELILKKTNVRIKDIFFLIKKYKVELVATDNVFELAANENELKKLFLFFPSNTKIVQITGNPASPTETLTEIARKNGFDVPPKLQPLDTAIIVAKLASMGVGYPFKLQEDETFIIISKAIEPSAGGMSFERYRRNIYANIQQAINDVKNILNANGFKYDLFFSKRAKEGCVFLVYSPKEVVKRFVKPYKGYGIKVRVIPVIKDSNMFHSISSITTRPIILAVDPGLSVGIAILGLDGSLVSLESLKYAGINSIIEFIIQKGKPVIITSDKHRPSNMVSKLASKFGSTLILPERDLSIEEKKKLVENYSNLFDIGNIRINSHMRDALAAAFFTFKRIYPTLIKIKHELKDFPLGKEEMYMIFEKVLKEKRSLREALEDVVKDDNEEIKLPVVRLQKQEDERNLDILRRKIEELERIIKIQELRLNEKDLLIAKLKDEINKLKDQNYIKIRENVEIASLKRRIEDLLSENKRLEDEIIEEKLLIKRLLEKIKEVKFKEVEFFEVINNLNEIGENIKEIIVVKNIEDISNKILTLLTCNKVKMIISLENVAKEIVNMLNSNGILVLNINEFDYYMVENVVFLKTKEIKEKLVEFDQQIKDKEKYERERIIKFLKDLREIKT